ncbi:hypothetical protein [Phenylobacterium immobile]|uniref:hypothetical protein n=1 Tax=Phenylobacterium immobile TaxID=21 RepID=UPI000A65BE9F|nr:hypothetical protein [Phenylobacterium immobile]
MGSATFVVGDLLAINQHMDIWCARPGCGRHERWGAVEAVRRLGRETPFGSLRDRMRCSGCGYRGRDFIDVRPCDLDGTAWGYRERIARHPGSFDFEGAMTRLRSAACGDLGGDGRVQWPPEASSSGG